jgi:cytochrome c oxidase assembly protein subunit 15
MARRLRISPERYYPVAGVALVALVALTLIVFTGAAVRVTGSGLGCPNWP